MMAKYAFLLNRTPRLRYGVPEGYDASDPRGPVNKSFLSPYHHSNKKDNINE